jgi:hypothetical protein
MGSWKIKRDAMARKTTPGFSGRIAARIVVRLRARIDVQSGVRIMKVKLLLPAFLSLALITFASAQTRSSASPAGTAAPASNALPGSASLGQSLAQIEQVAHQTSLDVAKLRIEKWKTDSSVRRQSQTNADSLLSNLTAALPEMIASSRAAPASVGPGLKIYRDLNVLYDVLSSLAESAGAFGSKDDYRALAGDTESLDAARHSLADYLESQAAAQDAEIVRLRSLSANSAAKASVPKKVVDDTEPVKKPVRKKKKAVPKDASSPAPAQQP